MKPSAFLTGQGKPRGQFGSILLRAENPVDSQVVHVLSNAVLSGHLP